MNSFISLLLFWKQYYHEGDKDSYNMEYSSQIPFSQFQQAVDSFLEYIYQFRNHLQVHHNKN